MEVSDIAGFPQRMINHYTDIIHKIIIPKDWRLIRPGEVLKPGDRFWDLGENNWAESVKIGKAAYVDFEGTLSIYIRNVWSEDVLAQEQLMTHYDNSGDWS